jgi:hypothetical protein
MRSHLEPFNQMVRTLKTHVEGVIAGMLQERSKAFLKGKRPVIPR